MNKVYTDIARLIKDMDLKDGHTISFHHHLREGDMVMKTVLEAISRAGIRDLRICSTSLMKCHDFLIEYIENGVVSRLETSGLRGELGKYVSEGKLDYPVVVRSHGGRARAVGDGEIEVDVAFIAASNADFFGNATGITGRNAFGSLGYGIWESMNAKKTVIVCDEIIDGVLENISISQSDTDAVLKVEKIGETEKVKTGSLSVKNDPVTAVIAKNTADFLVKSGMDLNGKGIQMGSGGISLQTVKYLENHMKSNGVKFKFAIGGITGALVEMLGSGLVESLVDVQSFDTVCADSLAGNKSHHEINVNTYANPLNKSCMVNFLDISILSALEIDTDWNVNVVTGSNGIFMGAVGGHQDVSESSGFNIIVSPLIRGRIPVLTDRVNTLVTAGEHVDAFICEYGICIREKHSELIENLGRKGIKNLGMENLFDKVKRYVKLPDKPAYGDKTVALIQDRHGGVIHEIKNLIG